MYGKGITKTTLHQSPFDNVKRQVWLTATQDWNGLRPQRKYLRLKKVVVCNKHFSADSFKVRLLSERKKLLPNSVPSIFLVLLNKYLDQKVKSAETYYMLIIYMMKFSFWFQDTNSFQLYFYKMSHSLIPTCEKIRNMFKIKLNYVFYDVFLFFHVEWIISHLF